MQTRTYGELIDLIQSLIGAGTMTGDDYLKLSNFINRRYSEAYNTSPSWTRYIVSGEERWVSALNISGITSTNADLINGDYRVYGTTTSVGTYPAAEGAKAYVPVDRDAGEDPSFIIYKNSNNEWVWRSTGFTKDRATDVVTFTTASGVTMVTQQDTEDRASPLDVLDWGTLSSETGTFILTSSQRVNYKEDFDFYSTSDSAVQKENIGEFIRIHRKKPFVNNSSIEYDFSVDIEGANILNIANTEDNTAFVTYKKELTLFTVAVSDPPVAADFVDGGTVNGAANRALKVPLEFFSYLAHASYADFLRMESKYEDARTEEAIAQNYLAQELEKIDIRNNNNSLNKKFSTYVNRQSR